MRRTKEETLQTREKILFAAEQVFVKQGIAKTTLEEIARAAGVTRGAIYWHFQNKVDLLTTIYSEVHMPMEEILNDILDIEGDDAIARLERHCADSLIQLHQDDRSKRVFSILLLKCEYSEEMNALIERLRATKERITDNLVRFFAHLQKTGQIATSMQPRVLALGLYAHMLGLYSDYLRYPDLYRMPQDAENLTRHFFAPLKGPVPSSET